MPANSHTFARSPATAQNGHTRCVTFAEVYGWQQRDNAVLVYKFRILRRVAKNAELSFGVPTVARI